MMVLKQIYLAFLVIFILAGSGVPSGAVDFLGVEVTPISAAYIVQKDVNVRALPKTKSKRLGRLKKGERVRGVGIPKDAAWVAVKKGGKNIGFVFAPVLLKVLDGSLDSELTGQTALGVGGVCTYSIRFDGKSPVDGELFEISDYEVVYSCMRKGKKTEFLALMFMAEAPFKVKKKTVHQITLDIREIGDGFEEVFSTNFLFDQKAKQLIFDGVSLKRFARKPAATEQKAADIREALAAVAKLAPSAWNGDVWKALAEMP